MRIGAIVAVIIAFGANPAHGFLSCPQTEQQYQNLLSQQGGNISTQQNQILLNQCYEEVKWRFEEFVRNSYRSPGSPGLPETEAYPPVQTPGMGMSPLMSTPGMGGNPSMPAPETGESICHDGPFKGQLVHPNKCLMGQGAEVMERLFQTFGLR
uniref:Uncharacterized protein n=1 Tax=Candidatus Kentrum sp. MB TaxID=2138164 RepID=A0A450XH33_9GAMM|nr:MAG: hypothetical protein BECKMB1821G_GA0114241_103822 [Candidatus Kentron sp. MB]VFK33118.1 MAG: hypothetical protein BECKMB1821I_GA0114274_104019 [Candidatus Kentron sp. MB]VFK76065.1 MAG: hypothetical protein BECKMB1821H_GA0114242_104019 [Candidatus Kentron sp. MB]